MMTRADGRASRLRPVLNVGLRLGLAVVVLAGIVFGVARLVARETEHASDYVSSAGPVMSVARYPDSAGRALSVLALRDRVNAAVIGREVGGLPACVDVRTEWGAAVFSRGDTEPRAIASNTKLFLTAAALLKLGPENKMKTFVVGNLDSKGRAQGGLWLVGGGDPFLSTLEFKAWEEAQEVDRPTTSLAALADSIVAAGVKSAPRIIGDAGVFDGQPTVAAHSRDLIAQKVISPISGLSINRNIKDWASTPKNSPTFYEDPAAAAAAELTRLLRERGVAIDGSPSSGPAPANTAEVGAVESAPMREIVGEINAESDNFAAEMLLKHLGAAVGGAGSTARGIEVMRDALRGLGIEEEGLTLADGSGLARNASSCRTIADLLVRMAATPYGGDYEASLAVAGSSGTLKKRFVDTPVQNKMKAKTGSLSDVAALSGYVDDGRGAKVVFAFILSVPKADRVRLAAEDSIARALVGYPAYAGPVALGQSASDGG